MVYTLLDEDGDENLSTKEFNPVSSSSSSSLLSISPSENTAIDTNIIYHIFIKYHKSYVNIIYQVLFSWRHSRGFQNGALSVTLGNMKFWTELNKIKFWTFWQHQILNFFLATSNSELFGNMKFWKIVFILIDPSAVALFNAKKMVPTITHLGLMLFVTFKGATCT